ncbi:MAG: trypsin-like peptidase domain-containing protein [Gemmatimonadaceae bacterium]
MISRRRGALWRAGASAPCALLAAGAIACRPGDAREEQETSAAPTGEARATRVSDSRRTAITTAVARVAPAVVTVQTESVERVPTDFIDQFFGGRPSERSRSGLGTGFVIRGDGVIVTNAHVIAGASRIVVMTRDGRTYPARLLGADETNDIAVLKVDARGLPVAPLGNSDSLLVGEWAIAIGNPYGFLLGNSEPSVTAGVISGVGRNLVERSAGPSAYFDMVQTDASINPGNSGGPLVNADGEVIGVNSSIYSTSGGSIGLGFAIPINRARRVVDDLLEHGAVRRPWVGIKLGVERAASVRDVLSRGVIVAGVTPGSPAARAGVQPGDVLVTARGRPLRNAFEWEARLLDLRVGEILPLRVRRGAREFDVQLRVADLPEASAPRVQVLRDLQLVTLTPAIRAERGISAQGGAVVYDVSPEMSETLGLQRGDVILQVNLMPVRSAEDAARAINYYAGRGPMAIFFEREGQVFRSDFLLR